MFAQKLEISDFFGYNNWYHVEDSRNYIRRSILNDGKYIFLTYCENGKISIYFGISYFDEPELRILRNLLYAMHGYEFSDKDLQKLFSGFSWYKASIKNAKKINFSDKEETILNYMIELEKTNRITKN